MSCSNCTKSFSLFNREHGCPACGFSVCSGCLKQSMMVKNKQQKVCNSCFKKHKNPPKEHSPPRKLKYQKGRPMTNSSAVGPYELH